MYPEKLCKAIVNGMLRQKEVDESDRISIKAMSRGQLSSSTKSLCIDLRRERAGIWSGGCSSVTSSMGINKPVGDWPAAWVDTVHDTMWKAWDDVTGADLNVEDVKAARALEMEYFEKLRVYDRVSRDELKRTGGKLIGTRWVDVNKGDSVNVDC